MKLITEKIDVQDKIIDYLHMKRHLRSCYLPICPIGKHCIKNLPERIKPINPDYADNNTLLLKGAKAPLNPQIKRFSVFGDVKGCNPFKFEGIALKRPRPHLARYQSHFLNKE